MVLSFFSRQISRQINRQLRKYNMEGRNFYMARTGENIYKRKDGRWEGRYIKGRKTDGKPVYGYVYARKYHVCREKLAQARSQHIHYKMIKMCGIGAVADFMNYWLYDIIQPHVKPSTFSNYAAILEKWINPYLGNKKLCRIDKEEVQHFIGILSGYGLSAGTVRNIFRVLSAAMKKAKEYGYVYESPCECVRLPESTKKEARLLTMQEQKRLEEAAGKDKNGFAILLAVYTGLRVGELCALTWADVDLKNGMLHVSRTTRRIQCFTPEAKAKTVLITGSAKSGQSVRTIPLPSCILKLLNEQRKKASGAYVFDCHGNPLEPRTLQYRFQVLLKKAGLPAINFHALRHTFATRCMELCFDVKTLSEILGHASAKMTLDRYGHSQLAHKQTAMKTLDRLFVRTA